MNASKSRALGFTAIALALVTLFVIGVLSYQDWKRYEVAYTRIREARRMLTLNESLLNRMRDAETSQRGFLLTGRQEYLDPYQAAVDQLPGELSELAPLANDDAGQRDRFQQLQTLIAEKLAELRNTLELRQYQGSAAALAAVETDQGKQTMDRIRGVSQQLEDAGTARWSNAWSDLSAGAGQLRIVTLLGAVLLVALVGIGGAALRSAALQMQQLVVELAESKRTAEEGRDLLRATLYSIGDGVITTDREGNVHMMNAVAERLTGYREAEALGVGIERIVQIVNQATRDTVENPVRRVLKDGQIVALANHTVLIPKTGPEVPIDDSAAPITGLGGGISGVVLFFRDVTERKKAFDVARRLASVVENSDDAIIGNSLDGAVTAWNLGAERIFGYSAEEMMGSSTSRLIPPDRRDDMQNILERIGQGESVHHHETERLTKDGRRIKVSLTVSPIRDGDGRVVGASKIARDITRQHQLEDMVRQTQKMEAVGRLAGGLAHDFNNLLTVILGYAATVDHRLPPHDPLRNTVAEILKAGERAASLTGQLLTFSRKQVTQPRVLDLNVFIKQTRDMLERLMGEDVDLAVVLEDDSCFVKVDSGQLTQILMNLTVNARDAMPTGGKLTIETQTVLRGHEDLGRRGVRPAGRYALVAVTDTGKGMDAETEAHLFEPFFTTKEAGKGTGLGLATVYGIVTQHSGWIDVYSEPGHGATFKIYLPSADGVKIEVPSARDESRLGRTATILLVEDQAAIRMLAEDVLSDAGHLVLSASNGRVALELAIKHRDHIDLLITDVVMPEMSGPDLADQLTKSRPGLIVLFISGYTDHALLHRGAIEQGTAFLQKPFLPETLMARVNELLREDASVLGAGQ